MSLHGCFLRWKLPACEAQFFSDSILFFSDLSSTQLLSEMKGSKGTCCTIMAFFSAQEAWLAVFSICPCKMSFCVIHYAL